MPYCSNCGREIEQDYEFCPECGASVLGRTGDDIIDRSDEFVNEKYKICRFCGERMPEDAFYCLSCGNTFDSSYEDFESIRYSVANSMDPRKRKVDTSEGVWKNKWVSLLLCIFFGVFGVHRFYEEKRITGFIYLCTGGLCGLGWFIDILLIATKPNPYRVK